MRIPPALGGASCWLLALGLGCGGGGTGGAGGTGGSGGEGAGRPPDAAVVETTEGRTYSAILPDAYDGSEAVPLIVMLHGFTDIPTDPMAPKPPEEMDAYFGMSLVTRARGIILALPLGSEDPLLGMYFWNATDTCCDLEGANPNDIGFIHGMVTELEGQYNIDPKRIFVVGHSNGGFMANRIACDSASRFAGIVSLAGMPFLDPEKCLAPAPIAMLHVHGTADPTVPYDGGKPYGIAFLQPAPGAIEAAAMWAEKNRCGAFTEGTPFDLDVGLAGPETTPRTYDACEANGATELWSIEGGVHSPDFTSDWSDRIVDFLLAHPKG